MNRNELEEVFLSSQEVFHGKLINVEHWQVRLPNGQTALREVVKHRGAAAIVRTMPGTAGNRAAMRKLLSGGESRGSIYTLPQTGT